MFTKFSEALGAKLADRWSTASLPSLLFWLGGCLAWVHASEASDRVYKIFDRFVYQPLPVHIAVVVGLLVVVVTSGELVDLMTRPALQFLEGYWHARFEPLRAVLVRRVERRVASLEARFQQLFPAVNAGTALSRERAEYVRLDRLLRRFPGAGAYQPTCVGNILRAAETRPSEKYGLESVVVWPHLWLLLPSTAQNELAAAYQSLSGAVGVVLWGVLFVGFAVWAWWALPVGLGVAILVYRFWLPPRAEVFADLVEAAFDLYRTNIYMQLRWPLPANPAAERGAGRNLTIYLWRGLDGQAPTFSISTSNKST